jgi:RNA polymerase sigma-70 factor (ECF subfamily)
MSQGTTTILVEGWLKWLEHPDSEEGRRARNELIEHTRRRMEALCRKMFFRSFDATGVIDWEDVYQEAALKLWKALADAKPTNVREYFGLATKKIREVSLDMCRKFVRDLPSLTDAGASYSPVTATMWSEFHEQVQKLDLELRETFELLWYHELTQKEAAEVLGVDESTVKRRWRRAREKLSDYVM